MKRLSRSQTPLPPLARRRHAAWSLSVRVGLAAWMGSSFLHAAPELKPPLPPEVYAPLLATDLPGQLERYFAEARILNGLSARFQGHYHEFIRTLDTLSRGKAAKQAQTGCLPAGLEPAYIGAREAWESYQQQARRVRSVQRGLEAYSRAGYAPGLTPDLQARLTRALSDYDRIRREHVNLEALLQQQLDGEVRRLGCAPEALVPPALVVLEDPGAKVRPTAEPAPTIVPPPAAAVADTSGQDPESDDPQRPAQTASGAAAEEIVSDDVLVPDPEAPPVPIATPAPIASDVPVLVHPEGENLPAASPEVVGTPEGLTPTPLPAVPSTPTPTPLPTPDPSSIPADLRVRYTVDNRQCQKPVRVYLDGAYLGNVAGGTDKEFVSTEGRHTLCLGSVSEPEACAEPRDYIRVILYDRFAVRPRC